MNGSRFVIATLVILAVQCAFADSVSFKITQATISVFPNDGSGDNVNFKLSGPGTSITGFGGIPCFSWCDPSILFAPGSSPPLDIGQIFLSGFGNVTMGGHSFDPETMSFSNNPLFSATIFGSFTFPKNPTSTFSACVPAAMPSSLNGFAGSDPPDFTNFVLQMPSGGKFCSKWVFVPKSGNFGGGFSFTRGQFVATTVPEPGTLGLLGLGLGGSDF